MKLFAKTPPKQSSEVLEIHVAKIHPNKYQPRKHFDEENLRHLARSIATDGIIHPLTVRREGDEDYTLVCGERRLRAARLAGLKTVPCIVLQVSERSSALLALVENLERRDLDFFEQAEGIAKLIDFYGMTQEDAAIRLGLSQPTVANKLRLLRLSEEEREIILALNLSERHARTLLRLENYADRLEVLELIAKGNLSVEKTESVVEKMLDSQKKQRNIRKNSALLRDVRLFLNTVTSAIKIMQAAGVEVKTNSFRADGELKLLIQIPCKGENLPQIELDQTA